MRLKLMATLLLGAALACDSLLNVQSPSRVPACRVMGARLIVAPTRSGDATALLPLQAVVVAWRCSGTFSR